MTVSCPGITPVTPSSLVTDRSADTLIGSVSVAELLPVTGSPIPEAFVAVAVLVNKPVALDFTNPLSVYVTVLPAGMLSVSDMLVVPVAVLPAAPPAATDDQLAPERSDGNVSVNVAPVTSDGPLLVTTIM